MLNDLFYEYARINNFNGVSQILLNKDTLIINKDYLLNLINSDIIQNSTVQYSNDNITNYINNNFADDYDREIMIEYFNNISTMDNVDDFINYTKGYEHIIILSIGQDTYSRLLSSLSIARYSLGYWVTSSGKK